MKNTAHFQQVKAGKQCCYLTLIISKTPTKVASIIVMESFVPSSVIDKLLHCISTFEMQSMPV